RTEKALIVALCIAGLAVQLCGLLVGPTAYHGATQFLAGSRLRETTGQVQPLADREQLLLFSPPQSPLVGNWPIIAHGRLDWFGVRFGQFFPAHLLVWLIGFLALAAGISAWRLLSAIRKVASGDDSKPIEPLPVGDLFPCDRRQVKIAVLVLLLNFAVLFALLVGLRGNGLRCTERMELGRGQIITHPVKRPIIYLDEDSTVSPELRSFTTEWTGCLEAPVSGEYSFYTVAQGAFELEIAGRLVLKNDAAGGRRSQRAELSLERGIHPIYLRYTAPAAAPSPELSDQSDASDRNDKRTPQTIARLMQLYWTLPGGGEYQQVIGRAWLYPDYPSQQRRWLAQIYRMKIGFVLVSIIAVWWLWLSKDTKLKREDIYDTSLEKT
ncbi:MAG: PA14 domain-containing protein, partial [Candidatus Sumerlaeia bacterium]|nr:PA14 domain-containing protein [Candidatus Sumerlaeia bacterium]